MNIAIDIDGVLANFTQPFQSAVNSLYPGRLEDGYAPKDFWYTEKLSSEESLAALTSTFQTHNLWTKLEPLPDAKELQTLLHELHMNAVDVIYATHRPKTPGMSSLAQTNRWLIHNDLMRGNTTTVVVDKSQHKAHLYEILNVKFSVDDRPDTILACQAVPGHRPYLLERSWNVNDIHLPRVRSMQEFVKIVMDKT
mgnify:FL=1